MCIFTISKVTRLRLNKQSSQRLDKHNKNTPAEKLQNLHKFTYKSNKIKREREREFFLQIAIFTNQLCFLFYQRNLQRNL